MGKTAQSTRQHILQVAGGLFYHQGFRAIGVDTIVEQSGIAKMTLYRYFPSKDDLIVAYLEDSNANFWEWWEQAISPYPGAPRDQLIALYEAVGKMALSPTCYGCTFQGAATEFPGQEHPGHRVALAHKQTVIERLRELAEQAGSPQPQILAEQLFLLMEGAFTACRMFGTVNPANPALNVAAAAAILIKAQLP